MNKTNDDLIGEINKNKNEKEVKNYYFFNTFHYSVTSERNGDYNN